MIGEPQTFTWTDAARDALARHWLAGLAPAAIAAKLGHPSPAAVAAMARILDLPRRHHSGPYVAAHRMAGAPKVTLPRVPGRRG